MNNNGIAILESFLGSGINKSKGNVAFHCPFCNHHKRKLEIHPEKQIWNCWTCGTKGLSIISLAKRSQAKKHIVLEVKNFFPNKSTYVDNTSQEEVIVTLPHEYIPLWIHNNNDFYYKTCIEYLTSRNINEYDIAKYKLGYCTKGKYKNMIIFPNYNKVGKLNYFTTRSFLRNAKIKFVNPPFPRNIVGFELQLNWTLPIILVESALDAIVIKRNPSPLYGKTLPKELKYQILENEVTDLYIALDEDAFKDMVDHAEYFVNHGINVYYVKLPPGRDPNELGYEKMCQLITQAKLLDETVLFQYKIQELI